MSNRTPRTNETREVEDMAKTGHVTDPRITQWCRVPLDSHINFGNSDNTNVSAKFREGWTPVKAEDHPELQVLPDIDSRFQGNVEVGGLLLCENSTEYVVSRRDAHDDMNVNQIQAVDNSYLKQSDARMPMMQPERSTKTSFGK